MSGGHFDYIEYQIVEQLSGEWRDEEINDLFYDLFEAPLWGNRTGGLMGALDYWQSGDIEEWSYRKYVNKFKDKWFKRTSEDRVNFYANKLQAQCEKYKKELAGELVI